MVSCPGVTAVWNVPEPVLTLMPGPVHTNVLRRMTMASRGELAHRCHRMALPPKKTQFSITRGVGFAGHGPPATATFPPPMNSQFWHLTDAWLQMAILELFPAAWNRQLATCRLPPRSHDTRKTPPRDS